VCFCRPVRELGRRLIAALPLRLARALKLIMQDGVISVHACRVLVVGHHAYAQATTVLHDVCYVFDSGPSLWGIQQRSVRVQITCSLVAHSWY
jgi:hypothetical protein